LSRWEIWESKKDNKVEHWDYLYKNKFLPFKGVRTIYLLDNFFTNKTVLVDKIEGEEIIDIIEFIENSPINYLFKSKYRYLGPNSNTYTQWIIKNFPKYKFKLKWNALGKNYE
jgi:hypothetical protein